MSAAGFLTPINGPVTALEQLLVTVHESTGSSWAAVLSAFTFALRGSMLPLSIYSMRQNRKLALVWPLLSTVHKQMMASNLGMADRSVIVWQTARARMKQLNIPLLSPVASLLVQIPLFITATLAVRGLTGAGGSAAAAGMTTGGVAWFTDLSLADPYYILPVVHMALFCGNLQLSLPSLGWLKYLRMGLQGGGLFLLPYFATLPAGVLLYWVTSSTWTMVQMLAFRHPDLGPKLLGARPEVPKDNRIPVPPRMRELRQQYQKEIAAATKAVQDNFRGVPVNEGLATQINTLFDKMRTEGTLTIPLTATIKNENGVKMLDIGLPTTPKEAQAKYDSYQADIARVHELFGKEQKGGATPQDAAAVNKRLADEYAAGRLSHVFKAQVRDIQGKANVVIELDMAALNQQKPVPSKPASKA